MQAKVRLQVVVVGAGLGGLACAIALARRGHAVTVLEQAVQLGEVSVLDGKGYFSFTYIPKVGAGIQIPSNSSRLLLSWGLGPLLESFVVEPAGMTFRRWENGATIGYTKLVPEFRNNFGAPYYVIHRAHFHDALYRRALELGVDVRVDSRVMKYNLEAPSVELFTGKTVKADFIVAADGEASPSVSWNTRKVLRINRRQICSERGGSWRCRCASEKNRFCGLQRYCGSCENER